jgi:hypothetical protein
VCLWFQLLLPGLSPSSAAKCHSPIFPTGSLLFRRRPSNHILPPDSSKADEILNLRHTFSKDDRIAEVLIVVCYYRSFETPEIRTGTTPSPPSGVGCAAQPDEKAADDNCRDSKKHERGVRNKTQYLENVLLIPNSLSYSLPTRGRPM